MVSYSKYSCVSGCILCLVSLIFWKFHGIHYVLALQISEDWYRFVRKNYHVMSRVRPKRGLAYRCSNVFCHVFLEDSGSNLGVALSESCFRTWYCHTYSVQEVYGHLPGGFITEIRLAAAMTSLSHWVGQCCSLKMRIMDARYCCSIL